MLGIFLLWNLKNRLTHLHTKKVSRKTSKVTQSCTHEKIVGMKMDTQDTFYSAGPTYTPPTHPQGAILFSLICMFSFYILFSLFFTFFW
jgi:hypothetical protein